jgi:hypothetical protein
MRADEEQWQRLMEDKEQLEAELNLLKIQEVRLTIPPVSTCALTICHRFTNGLLSSPLDVAPARTPAQGRNKPQGRPGKVFELDQDSRGKGEKDGGWEWQAS